MSPRVLLKLLGTSSSSPEALYWYFGYIYYWCNFFISENLGIGGNIFVEDGGYGMPFLSNFNDADKIFELIFVFDARFLLIRVS